MSEKMKALLARGGVGLNHIGLHANTGDEGGDEGGDYGDEFTPSAGGGGGDDKGGDDKGGDDKGGDDKGGGDKGGDDKGGDDKGGDDKGGDDKGDDKGGDKGGDDKGFMIPKSRYDAAKARERKLLDELARLKSGDKGAGDADKGGGDKGGDEDPLAKIDRSLNDLDEKIAEAVSEGKGDEVKSLMAEQRKLERQRADVVIDQKARSTSTQTREQMSYESRLNKLETDYPVINPDAEGFDEDIATEMVEMRDAYLASGKPMTEALELAAKYVLKDHAPTGDKPAEKRETDIERNIDAEKRSPADLRGAGDDSDKGGRGGGTIDVMKMSDDEFDRMTEEELAKARGDTV